MEIIDGNGAILGRLASYAAKKALKGEEIIIVNCDKLVISGNKENIKENFESKKRKIGSGQKGPKHYIGIEKIVKGTIRGMIPDYRIGRGRIAYRKIKCFSGVPDKFKDAKKITANIKNVNALDSKSLSVADLRK